MLVFARIFSLLFHPVIFFLITPYLVVYRQTHSNIYSLKWAVFSAVFIFLGAFLFLMGRLWGIFSDHDISKREERYKFYIILYLLSFVYFVTALFFKGIFFPLSIIVFGVIIGVGIFDFVNRFIKASIHIGVGCAYVITMSILYGPSAFLVTFWVIPVIFWARVRLKRHTLQEGLAGAFLGSAITFLTFLIGKYLYLG